MTGFSVEPERLETFARTSDARKTDFAELRGEMHQIRVGRDSFGHIPFIGSKIYEAYDEHVAACEEAVTSAMGAMSAVASGVRAVAAAYSGGDAAMGEDLNVWQRAIEGVEIGGHR